MHFLVWMLQYLKVIIRINMIKPRLASLFVPWTFIEKNHVFSLWEDGFENRIEVAFVKFVLIHIIWHLSLRKFWENCTTLTYIDPYKVSINSIKNHIHFCIGNVKLWILNFQYIHESFVYFCHKILELGNRL